jgi:hypothetical protein
MSAFKNNARILIADYYESLRFDVDIYTEEELKKAKDNNTLTNTIEIAPHTTFEDYLNKTRSDILNELKKVEKECIDYYNAVDLFKAVDVAPQNDIESLKSQLFANKFCFIANICSQSLPIINCDTLSVSYRSLFDLYVVITDFYLSPNLLEYFK